MSAIFHLDHDAFVLVVDVSQDLLAILMKALGTMMKGTCAATLDAWRRLGLTRYPAHGLLERSWALRDHLSAYDAGYVALAESLDCSLVTADTRISRARGIRCPVTVVPR